MKHIKLFEEFINERKEEYSVRCYDGSYQFWASDDDKTSFKSIIDAHKYGQKHCTKDGMWYTIIDKNNNELYQERTKREGGKFIKKGMNFYK